MPPRTRLVLLGTMLAAQPVAAQQNPFALTSPSVKTAYIVYEMSNKGTRVPGATVELGVTGGDWVMRLVAPFEIQQKKDTLRSLSVETADSVYRYNALGAGPAEAEASPSIRGHLVRAYDALDATSKARLLQNLRLAAHGSDDEDFDRLIAFTGKKTGSETIAGQRYDVYTLGGVTACVLPQAPTLPLRWSDKGGNEMVASKVTLNGRMPAAMSVLPKGVKWKQDEGFEGGDFAMNLWSYKHPEAQELPSAAQVGGFAVKYLASAQAAAELREMSGGGEDMGYEDGEEEASE